MEKPDTSPIPPTSMPVRSRGRLSAFAAGALAAVAMLLGTQDALARPANPKPLTRVQPDGTEVRIRALGDERVVFYEDEEGFTVLREADGWWRYADPRSHKAEKLVATRLRVGHDRMPEGSQKHVRPRVDPRTFHIEWDQTNDGTIAELFKKWREKSGSSGRSMAALGTSTPNGVPLLVIPIEFSDWYHTSGPGTPRTWEPDYNPNVTMLGNTAAAWEDLFGDPTVPGGLNHYYDEVSYGQFQWTVKVASCDPANGAHPTATCNGGWYRNANTMAYWGGDRKSGTSCSTDGTNNIKDLIEWAIKAAEPDVNYVLYDTDGNGQISDAELMILVVHARDGQENYGSGCDGSDPANDHIWSHKWQIDSAVTADGKTFPIGKTYSINPEFEPGLVWNATRAYYDVVDKWFGVGVYAHESFHTLGAPDLYDYGYDANVAGEWDLMDSGSYNGAKSGTHPAHMGSPLKQDINLNTAGAYGWIYDTEMVKVHTEGAKVQSIDALSGPNATNVMHQLVMPVDATEWIVLENRAPVGYYEPYLPEHGILAWHRDTNGGRDAWPYAANVLRKGWANTATGLNTTTAGAAFSFEDGETVFTSTSDPNNRTNSGAVSNLLDVKCIGAEGTRMPYVYGSISGANPGFGGATVSGGTDSDPWLDNGETATLTVSVSNSSCAGTAATGVEITLDVVAGGSIDPSAVTITPATVSLGNIAAGASVNAVFSVSLACDDPALYAGKSLELAFTITATNVVLPVTGTFSKAVQKDYSFFDDAEGGTTGWTSVAPFNPSSACASAAGHGSWAWQAPTDRFHSFNRAYHTPETTASSNLAYTNPNEVWVSPNFTVPSGAKQLRFWSAANIPATGYTRARVWVSSDGGTNWTRLNWYKDAGDVAAWEEVVYDLEGFDAATQLKLMFAMYTYGCWPVGTASAEGWYVDDVSIVVDEQGSCSACTTPPGAPTITSVTDADACAESGVRVSYTAGSGATSHDLLEDGVLAVSGYVSGALYDPGDGASHAYVVRALKTGCPSADSAPSSFADANASPAAPGAPTVSDADACLQTGVTVTWAPVAGAIAYDLLVDAMTFVGVASPYSYNPGDTASHTYRVRARTATCTGPFSATTTASDAATAPGPATISSITDADGCLASGIRVNYAAGAGATRHDLVRDGAVVVTDYASGTVYVPGDTASHAYVVRAVAGSCTTDSEPQTFADGTDCLCTAAPAFAGLETVVPLSGTTCGLRLSWSAATSSCPNGPAVTYAVYRSTDSGFTPASANLVASCLATTTWDDTSALSGTTYFYVVRAEDSTAFGTGPCNSGNADSNTVRRSGAVAEVTVIANQGSAAIATSGSATAALSPAIGILTPSSATLNYALSYVPAGTSATVVIQPSIADTYVNASAPTTNYGTGTLMSVISRKVSGAAAPARSLVQFSLAAIPAGATITAATLELYGTGTVNRSYNVHRITGAWTEGSATWNVQPTFTGTADASTATGTVSGWKSWNVRTVVQQWVSGTANYGLLVKDSIENTNSAPEWRFATKENATTANRPILRVTYTTSSGTLTANTRVELLDPVGTSCTVKAYGAADPTKPVDVSSCYTGPGTYQLRVSENGGGTATLSGGSLSVTGLTCVPASAPNPTVLTLRSTFEQNKLEWENPPGGPHGAAMIRYRTDGSYPASPSDGAEATCAVGSPVYDPAGGAYNACLHTGLTNGTPYRYTLFLANASGVWSSGKRVAGTPFDHTSGPVKWAYSTGATAMTPPGVRPGAIGTGAVFAVSNDRILHASNPTGSGGDWPRTAPFSWNPVPMNGPVQDRPAPLPDSLGMDGVGMITFLGSQDGSVYAVDAQRGDADPATPGTVDPIWVSAERIGDFVQGSPTGVLTRYGSSWDLVFAASRNSASANRVVALNPVVAKPYPGAATTAWTFDNGGSTDPANAIGMVSSSPYPVYGGGVHRLYFTSRKRTGGSSDTVWGLSFTNLAPTKLWSAAVGDTDAAPAVQAGRVYVGTNEGKIYALDAETGAPVWDVAGQPFFATSDGPVKGGLTVVSGSFPRKIYFSTTTTIWCLVDQGATVTEAWRVTSVPGPSKPVRAFKSGFDRLYAGSSDGSLYELDALQTPPAIQREILGAGDAAIGMPTIDTVNELVHVGSESGAFYAARVPLK